jgi:hypothetical protein
MKRATKIRPARHTVIKGRGVTIKVDEKQMAAMDAEDAQIQTARDHYSATFDLFDGVETARYNVGGTVQVMAPILDKDGDVDEGVAVTLECWLKADLAAMDAAMSAAREAILSPPMQSPSPRRRRWHRLGDAR